MTNVSERKLII